MVKYHGIHGTSWGAASRPKVYKIYINWQLFQKLLKKPHYIDAPQQVFTTIVFLKKNKKLINPTVGSCDDAAAAAVFSIADEEPSPGVEPSPPTAIAMLTPVAVAADVEVSIALAEPPAEVTVEVSMTPAAGGDDDGATTPVGRVCGGEAVTDETAASLQTTQASR